MVYIEYFEREPLIPFEIFRHLGDQGFWTDTEDERVGCFGRTMRLGPAPSYLALWKSHGFSRLDEWESYFRSDASRRNVAEQATMRVIQFQCAGCYDEIIAPSAVDPEGLFYIEYFKADENAATEDVAAHFKLRVKKHAEATLCFVLRRIGKLGPEPGSLAGWRFNSYADMEPFARELPKGDPYRPLDVGVYRWFGKEIL